MPDQNQPADQTQNPTPAIGGTPNDQGGGTTGRAQVVEVPEPTNPPPTFSSDSDIPPLPQGDVAAGGPATSGNQGSAAPPFDIPSVVAPPPKKKFPGGQVIATILGILILVGGVIAGRILIQRQQELREQAAEVLCDDFAHIGEVHCNTFECKAYKCIAEDTWDQVESNECDAFDACKGGQPPAEPVCGDGACNGTETCTGANACTQDCSGPACGPPGTGGGASGVCDATSCTAASGQSGWHFTCPEGLTCGTLPDDPNYACRCQSNPVSYVGPKTESFSADSCTAEQIDLCNTTDPSNCNVGTLVGFTIKDKDASCGTATAPPATAPPGTTTASFAQCLNVRAWDTSWSELTIANGKLTAVKAGDTVRFTIAGTTTPAFGRFDRGVFTINAGADREGSPSSRPGASSEFFYEYTIPAGTTSFTITAKIHHMELNEWIPNVVVPPPPVP